jgi:hypothetical protein
MTKLKEQFGNIGMMEETLRTFFVTQYPNVLSFDSFRLFFVI